MVSVLILQTVSVSEARKDLGVDVRYLYMSLIKVRTDRVSDSGIVHCG